MHVGFFRKFERLNHRLNQLFFADKWNIGYIKQSPGDFVARKGFSSKIHWLTEDRADYCADPFILNRNGTDYIYYEHLNHWDGLGKIYQINNFDFRTKKKVSGLYRNVHLSYPYVFMDGNDCYCIPETARANEIGLYCIEGENLTNFKKKKVLVADGAYVDSSMVKYNGKYWLITTRRNTSDLYIFYADSLEDEFKSHPMNPVVHTDKSFRSGGTLFTVDGVLYRPVQNCALRYGGSLIINKITRLTEEEYESEFCFEVLPSEPYTRGLHNISFGNDLIVIDGKKSRFSLFMPFKMVNRYIKYLRG